MSTAPAEGEVVIRTATGDDLDGIVRVGHETWRATYEPIAGPEFVEMGLAKWWTGDAVIPGIRVGRTLVADDAGTVVGMASYGSQDDELVLWKLYVLPAHQGRGLGRRLLDEVVERASRLGHAQLHVSYIEGNDQAGRFYQRNGFRHTHREAGGSGLPEEIWMVKDLPADSVVPASAERSDADSGTHERRTR
jgi:GNAT superfamily N-acetyltransferase